MAQIKGPALFLAQFLGDAAPFDTLENITAWAKSLGYLGVQLPADPRIIDIDKAAESKAYCDDLRAKCNGLVVTELATHLIGQLVAVHPAYDALFDGFAPPAVQGNPTARTEWAIEGMKKAIKATRNLGCDTNVTFSGSFLWHTLYPWPQRPAGLVEMGFAELVRRWKPIFDAAEEHGVNVGFELHPGEDLHDGVTFERFLEGMNGHKRVGINYDPSHFVLQCMDYLGFIDAYADRIYAYHVKDAEYNQSAKSGVYAGYQAWADRPGRFRSLGDGQVDFGAIFSKLTQYGYKSWAVLEWECCIKDGIQGAIEGAEFIKRHLIDVPTKAFDDFAGGATDPATLRQILGL